MKPEEQRIAIAKACGWERTDPRRSAWPELCWKEPDAPREGRKPWQGLGGFHQEVPDYLNDLNAMHEAEKILSYNQKEAFIEHLGCCWDTDITDTWGAVHATAAQRAEAFLRTLNLWKDK